MDEQQNVTFNNTPSNNYQNNDIMTVGQWLITLIVLAIPCVNVIMYIVWAVGNGNQNRKNFCIAGLIMMAVGVVIGFLFTTLFGLSAATMMGGYY